MRGLIFVETAERLPGGQLAPLTNCSANGPLFPLRRLGEVSMIIQAASDSFGQRSNLDFLVIGADFGIFFQSWFDLLAEEITHVVFGAQAFDDHDQFRLVAGSAYQDP